MTGVSQMCGLRVAGRLAPVGRISDAMADVVMEAGHVAFPGGSEALDGQKRNGRGITIRQGKGVVFVRFHGVADAAVDMNAGTATIELSASSPPGLDEVLAAGPVLALVLAMRGQPCLHASAVSMNGQAVAFTAPSGGGKSTLAALACLAAAELVADDILALAVNASDVRCLPGSRELRLRPPTAELLADAPWSRRQTADGRVAMLAGREELDPPRLSAIVLPMVTAEGVAAVEVLGAAAATRALLACARVVSLRTPEYARAMLTLAATLGTGVPVYRVRIPTLSRPTLSQPILSLLEEHFGTWL